MKPFVFLLFLFGGSFCHAQVSEFTFDNALQEKRYRTLVAVLRCPTCQNQNLADSNSTVASALRLDLYNLLTQGRSDAEIIDLMVGRYGEFVLYRPRVSSITYILWFGPVLLILIGLIVVIIILRKKPITEENLALDSQQQEKLQQLLQGQTSQSSPSNTSLSSNKKDKE